MTVRQISRTFRSRCKEGLLNGLSFVLFYSRALRLVNRFVNRVQPKKNQESGLAFPFIKTRRTRNIQIFVYHRVNDEFDRFFPAVSTSLFSKQMEYLASNYNVLSLEDAVERMNRNDIPDNAVVVTFDDGYKDNYLNAYLTLQRLSMPATIFLATDVIGSGRALWHDRVFSAFRETLVRSLDGFGGSSTAFPLRTVEEKLFAQREVLSFLRSLEDSKMELWIERLVETLQVVDRKEATSNMLTWDDVKVMHRGGISFGSHTATHPILSRISTNRAREELYGSKKVIEEHLGVPVRTFAYPNGGRQDYSEETKKILRELGYMCALTTVFGTNEINQDRFELRRGTPWESYLPAFATKVEWHRFQSYE